MRNRILSEINNTGASVAFRSTSTYMRDRDSDQAFLDRLSKLMSFVWVQRETLEDPDTRMVVDLRGNDGYLDRLVHTDEPDVFWTKIGTMTKEQVLQKVGIIRQRVTSLQVRLYNFNNELDEVVLEFPAPRFTMPGAELLC